MLPRGVLFQARVMQLLAVQIWPSPWCHWKEPRGSLGLRVMSLREMLSTFEVYFRLLGRLLMSQLVMGASQPVMGVVPRWPSRCRWRRTTTPSCWEPC